MKNYCFILLIMLTFMPTLKAQDQLFKKDNTKLLVKIQEVGPEEIKYKLFNNLNGPVYVESKSNIAIIIFENGQSETFNSPGAYAGVPLPSSEITRQDSIAYFKYRNNISVNFLNIFNNEVGLIYQREFFKSQFNIVVPVAFGLEKPGITQSVYFDNRSNGTYRLDNKLFEIGFGINYYPALNSNTNYFIGPVFRYMQYNGTQTAYVNSGGYGSLSQTITQGSTLSRYCVSITNGVVIRTRSRLTATFFASLGFKNDMVSNSITNPYNGSKIDPINANFSLYFWSGINVGFSF